MKKLKYIFIVLAVVAMGMTYASCSKDADPEVDAKDYYLIEFTLSNPGSLNAAAQTRFSELVDTIFWGDKGATHYPMYVSEARARENFEALAALPNSEADIVQKVMLPVSKIQNVRDFVVTMSLLQGDTTKTELESKLYRASEVLSGN